MLAPEHRTQSNGKKDEQGCRVYPPCHRPLEDPPEEAKKASHWMVTMAAAPEDRVMRTVTMMMVKTGNSTVGQSAIRDPMEIPRPLPPLNP